MSFLSYYKIRVFMFGTLLAIIIAKGRETWDGDVRPVRDEEAEHGDSCLIKRLNLGEYLVRLY